MLYIDKEDLLNENDIKRIENRGSTLFRKEPLDVRGSHQPSSSYTVLWSDAGESKHSNMRSYSITRP